MSNEEQLSLRAVKCSRIIQSLNELYGISLKEAADILYLSDTFHLIEEEVADLQCRSDKYLASLIWEEYTDGRRAE